jgi:hypothetical protein
LKNYKYLEGGENFANFINILQHNQAIFLEEDSANSFFDVAKRLTERKDIHMADDKRFLMSVAYVMRKELPNELKEMIDSMYAIMKCLIF